MTALTFGFPARKTVPCTNPVCEANAVFVVHTRDGKTTPACLDHVLQYQAPGCRLVRLGENGTPDTATVADVAD